MTDASDALPMKELVDAFGKLQSALIDCLDTVTEELFAQRAPFSPLDNPDETIGSLMAGLLFHESYHVGQLGIIRKLIGKPGLA